MLVVDPCEDNRDSLAALLNLWGHAVRLAHDGPSALAVGRAFRPQAVVLEIRLAAVDGWDVGRRLRQQVGSRRPLLVALTGYGREQDRARSREAGPDAHLARPADPLEVQRLSATATGACILPGPTDPRSHFRQHPCKKARPAPNNRSRVSDSLTTGEGAGVRAPARVGTKGSGRLMPNVKSPPERKENALPGDEPRVERQESGGPSAEENACLLERREEPAQAEWSRLAALRADIALSLAANDPVPAVLLRCAELLVRHLDVAFARVWTLGEAEGVLELRASAGLYTHLDGPHSRVRVGEFKIGRIAQSGRPHLTNAVPDDPRVSDREWARREGMVAFAGYPLAVEGRVVGVLAMFARRPLSGRVLADLTPVADGVAQYVERKRAEQALRDADRRKDEFLAVLAHELRNTLAPVRNALQVMRLAPADADVAGRARELVERQVGQMTRLVDDLLDISRISCGKIDLRRERVELAAVVRRAVETSTPLVEAGGHEMTVALPPGRLWLDADPARLAQVLSNLLNNAAKYTDRGGRVWLTADRDGGQAVLRVRDTGVGIPPDVLPRLFDLFTQADRTLGRSQGGLGVGLSLVRRLVELHGGTVTAHSEGPGRGSEFVVRLPLLRGAAEEVAPPAQAAAGVSPCRVLVVDDNRDGAESLALLLRLWGHDARTAPDGPAAIEAADSFRPEAVFLDIGLPGMDGCEVARELRRLPGLDGAVLIALTGHGGDEDRRRCADAGFDRHLLKPVDLDAVRGLLADLPCGRVVAHPGRRR